MHRVDDMIIRASQFILAVIHQFDHEKRDLNWILDCITSSRVFAHSHLPSWVILDVQRVQRLAPWAHHESADAEIEDCIRWKEIDTASKLEKNGRNPLPDIRWRLFWWFGFFDWRYSLLPSVRYIGLPAYHKRTVTRSISSAFQNDVRFQIFQNRNNATKMGTSMSSKTCQ